MQEQEKNLEELDIEPLIVTFEAGFMTRLYVQDTGLKWPLLIDEDRTLYRGYGMLHARWWELWGPATIWIYFKELLRGKRPVQSSGDVSQRGGDVLIDPAGIVRLHHIGRTPADRPPVKSILQIVREYSS